jgi:hypothetical protein
MSELDFEIDIEDEEEQLSYLRNTFERILINERFDLFNASVLKCIDHPEKQELSTLLLVAFIAKKYRKKVPLFMYLIGVIKGELEKRKYSQSRSDEMLLRLIS